MLVIGCSVEKAVGDTSVGLKVRDLVDTANGDSTQEAFKTQLLGSR